MKQLKLLLLFGFIFGFTWQTYVFAQDEPTQTADPETQLETTPDPESQPETTATDDTTSGEVDYLIYVHQDCPHCQNVEEFVSQNNLEQYIEYKELKNNEANLAELESEWEKFSVPEGDMGWPFMVITYGYGQQEYLVGDIPIINHFEDEFDVEASEVDADESSTGDILFLALGGLFLVGIVGYGVYSALSKNKK